MNWTVVKNKEIVAHFGKRNFHQEMSNEMWYDNDNESSILESRI